MARHKNQVARRRTPAIPLQVVVGVDGLAVLIHAIERHVDVVTRISKVVRITAKKCCLLLGRKYQPHVGIRLILIQPVFATVVERDHIRAKTSGLLALFLNGRSLCFLSFQRLRLIRNSFGRILNALGHILHAHQHVDFKVGRFQLLVFAGRIKPVVNIVMLSRRVLLQLIARHVVIGQQQSVGTDK